MSAPFNEQRALAFRLRPEASDPDVNMDVIIQVTPSDQPRPCCRCRAPIPAGAWARVRFEIDRRGEQAVSHMFRACTACCVAMAASEPARSADDAEPARRVG